MFFSGALLTPTLIETCLLGAILALAAWRTERRALLLATAGVALGLATLGRGNALLLLALAPLFFRVELGTWRRALPPWLVFAAAALALPTLVTLRNAAVEGRLVPVSANYAAFYIGHFPKANGLYVSPEMAASSTFADEVVGVRETLSRELGRPLTQAEASGELLARGLRWAGAHPREELVLAARKLYLFANSVEAHTNLSYYVARDFSGLLRSLPIGFGFVVSLGLAGMLAARRRWREHLLLHLAVVVPLVTCVVFFVSSEYRLPAVAPLLLFGAGAIVQGVTWLAARLRPAAVDKKRRGRAPAAAAPSSRAQAIPPTTWLALGITPLLLWGTHVTSPLLRTNSNSRAAYQNYVLAYANRGENDRAADMLRRLRASDPAAFEADLLRVKADELLQAERYAEALPELEQARARYTEQGRREEATNAAISIGLALSRVGRHAEAERLLSGIIATDPGDVTAHVNLGLVYEAQGRDREAEVEYRRALALQPDEPNVLAGLERLGRASEKR